MNQREANKQAARIVGLLIEDWLNLIGSEHEVDALSPADQARLDEALKRIQRQMEDRADGLVGRGGVAPARGERS